MHKAAYDSLGNPFSGALTLSKVFELVIELLLLTGQVGYIHSQSAVGLL